MAKAILRTSQLCFAGQCSVLICGQELWWLFASLGLMNIVINENEKSKFGWLNLEIYFKYMLYGLKMNVFQKEIMKYV